MPVLLLIGKQLGLSVVVNRAISSGATQVALRNTTWTMNSMKTCNSVTLLSRKKLIFWYQQEVHFTKYARPNHFGKMHFLLVSEYEAFFLKWMWRNDKFSWISRTDFITMPLRSAVGQLNKLPGKHFFIPSAENLSCRRVREAKNQLCLA